MVSSISFSHFPLVEQEILHKRTHLLKKQARQNLRSKKNIPQEIVKMIESVGSPWQPTAAYRESLSETNQTILQLILGEPVNKKQILKNKEILKTVLFKRNPEFMKEIRQFFQGLLNEIGNELTTKPPETKEKNFHAQVMVGNLLSFYVYISPQTGETLNVPMYIDGAWQIKAYQTEKIKLTHPALGSPLVACGLTAQDAPPLLIFKGTTYPQDDGFLLSIMTDLAPFAGVADLAFSASKSKISAWFKKNTENGAHKAQIFGTSLGGALVQKAAIHFADYIEKGYAFDPPGLSASDLAKLKKQSKTPEMNIICQHRDRVHELDCISEKWNYHRIFGNKDHPSRYESHATSFSIHKNSIITRLNPKNMAKSPYRFFLTAVKHILCLPLFLIFAIIWLFTRLVQSISSIAKKCCLTQKKNMTQNV